MVALSFSMAVILSAISPMCEWKKCFNDSVCIRFPHATDQVNAPAEIEACVCDEKYYGVNCEFDVPRLIPVVADQIEYTSRRGRAIHSRDRKSANAPSALKILSQINLVE